MVSIRLAPGNAAEPSHLADLLSGVPVEKVNRLIADKAYDTNAVRKMLSDLGVEAVIPAKSNRRDQLPYNREAYQGRHLVENRFADLKQFRGIATRYCKLVETFAGGIHLVAWYLETKQRRQRNSRHLAGL